MDYEMGGVSNSGRRKLHVTITLQTYSDGTDSPSGLRNHGSWPRVLPNSGFRWSLILSAIAIVLGTLSLKAGRHDVT